ncbi:MAG TPA: cyclopropane-fatty-acyl-phospholipid synthase family protein [Candidatus Krumholzibacteria bacterium]|nr:cyclopropane-fatty-acyl-phospholipid synthase family protein [Candidatus Krumholzibacteria bacterium]
MTAVQPSASANTVEALLDRNMVPDPVIRLGIRRRCARKLRELSGPGVEERHELERAFVDGLRASEVAIHTDKANEQHYELPPEFFERVLGPRLKYSSGYWPAGVDSLEDSEVAMLDLYLERAKMVDGQDILELGCGWGSLTLYMAETMPNSRITAVSNSAPQRAFILGRARERGLDNVEVITEDVNRLDLDRKFDRAISIEMFEHMKNYERLLGRIAGMLKSGGLLFVHMFTHRRHSYHYEVKHDGDWMARYFFTGGTMAADDLMLRFQNDLVVRDHWRLPGSHYEKTSNAWLRRMDSQRAEIVPVLAETYGEDEVVRWWSRWRIFFMACAEMFGYDGGREWLVSHYLMQKRD